MADINSPLGRRNFAMQQNQRRVLSVPDEGMMAESSSFDDDFVPNERDRQIAPESPPAVKRVRQMINESEISREDLQRMRQDTRQSKMEVSPSAKNRIDILLGLKRKTKDVTIDGINFSLKTLKHSEYQGVFSALSKLNDANNIVVSLEMQIQSLARSISHIDGVPVKIILDAEDISQIINCLREFDSDVIDQLYEAFKSLKEATQVKPEEESEVVENLKK